MEEGSNFTADSLLTTEKVSADWRFRYSADTLSSAVRYGVLARLLRWQLTGTKLAQCWRDVSR